MAPVRKLDRRAGSRSDEFPGVALKIGGRSALAGGARASGAVVLPLQGDAEAFLFLGSDRRFAFSLCQRRGGCDGGERCRNGAGDDQ